MDTPVRTAEPRFADQSAPVIDPTLAVEIMIAEVEVLRLQADLAQGERRGPDQPLRDLSPLGR
jgi:hypothetical protein